MKGTAGCVDSAFTELDCIFVVAPLVCQVEVSLGFPPVGIACMWYLLILDLWDSQPTVCWCYPHSPIGKR